MTAIVAQGRICDVEFAVADLGDAGDGHRFEVWADGLDPTDGDVLEVLDTIEAAMAAAGRQCARRRAQLDEQRDRRNREAEIERRNLAKRLAATSAGHLRAWDASLSGMGELVASGEAHGIRWEVVSSTAARKSGSEVVMWRLWHEVAGRWEHAVDEPRDFTGAQRTDVESWVRYAEARALSLSMRGALTREVG
jgi:hypothetical protein